MGGRSDDDLATGSATSGGSGEEAAPSPVALSSAPPEGVGSAVAAAYRARVALSEPTMRPRGPVSPSEWKILAPVLVSGREEARVEDALNDRIRAACTGASWASLTASRWSSKTLPTMLAEWIADVFPLIRSRLVDAPPQAGESAQRMRDLLAGPEALSRREKPVQRARPLARDELTVPEPLDEDEWAAVRKCVTLRNAEQERQFEGVLFRGANRVPWSQVPVDDFGEREAVRCFLLRIRRTGELLDLKNRLAADEFGLGPGARLRRLVEDALALDGYEPRCA